MFAGAVLATPRSLFARFLVFDIDLFEPCAHWTSPPWRTGALIASCSVVPPHSLLASLKAGSALRY